MKRREEKGREGTMESMERRGEGDTGRARVNCRKRGRKGRRGGGMKAERAVWLCKTILSCPNKKTTTDACKETYAMVSISIYFPWCTVLHCSLEFCLSIHFSVYLSFHLSFCPFVFLSSFNLSFHGVLCGFSFVASNCFWQKINRTFFASNPSLVQIPPSKSTDSE